MQTASCRKAPASPASYAPSSPVVLNSHKTPLLPGVQPGRRPGEASQGIPSLYSAERFIPRQSVRQVTGRGGGGERCQPRVSLHEIWGIPVILETDAFKQRPGNPTPLYSRHWPSSSHRLCPSHVRVFSPLPVYPATPSSSVNLPDHPSGERLPAYPNLCRPLVLVS